MATVKITELPILTHLSANNANTVFVAVDKTTNTTSQFSTTTLAGGLYENNVLNVGTSIENQNPNVVAQFVSNTANYSQIWVQNINEKGSGDFVITANNGDDANNYIDMGIQGSAMGRNDAFDLANNDGYLYVQGKSGTPNGNLWIGTGEANTDVVVFLGGTVKANEAARFNKNGLALKSKPITFADNTTQNTAAVTAAHSQVIFNQANSAYNFAINVNTYAASIYTVANTQSNNITVLQGINLTQNTNITTANNHAWAGFALANTNAGAITVIQGVNTTQNTNITTANNHAWAAYAKANTALANTTGIFDGTLTITGDLEFDGTASIQATDDMFIGSDAGVQIQTDNGGVQKQFQFGVDGSLSLPGNITVNGTMVLANSNFSPTESAVTISATPTVALPSNDGYMLHISGKDGVPSRIVYDSYGTGAYGVVAGRTARGTVASPAAVANNDILMRVSGNGHGGGANGWTQFGVARMDIVATENYNATNRGSQIQFWNCPIGSNTLQQIATFNGDSVHFTGVVNPQKGFVLTPNVLSGITTTLNVNIANNSLYYFKTNATTTINLSNFTAGKVVEVWLTNIDTGGGSNHTITHGCYANNSTVGATSFTLTSLHSAYIKYFSIGGDLANTYCHISYS